MSPLRWLWAPFAGWLTANRERPDPGNGFRPRLEALEDRALPSTLTVLNTADSGPGSLRDTIAAAQSGDTIDFAPAVFGRTVDLTSGELVIDKSLTIECPADGAHQVEIGNFPFGRAIDITNSSASVVLANLRIEGEADMGGAVLNQGANLSLLGCWVNGLAGGSAGARGGGVYSAGGTLTISNSFVTGGAIAQTGAIKPDALGGVIYVADGAASITNTILGGYADSVPAASSGRALGVVVYLAKGKLTVTGCNFDGEPVALSDGYAAGGAIYQAAGSVVVDNCSFNGSSAETLHGDSAGGAIYSADGDLTVNNSAFLGDGFAGSTVAGGAIYKANGALNIQNTSFQLCSAFNGGAVYLAGCTGTIANCDFAKNDTAFGGLVPGNPAGGAIYVASGSLTLSNCTFAGNGIDPYQPFTIVGTAIDIAGGSVTISKNTFSGPSPLTEAEVVGPFAVG